MNRSQQVLLVVDVQNGFVNSNTRHIIAHIKTLVRQWQSENRGPVVYSQFINLEKSPWQRLLGSTSLQSEPDTALHPDLPVENAHVFKKSTYSAWSAEVEQLCMGHGIDSVVLCGIDTDQCVLETAIDIFEANLRPILLTDCCASSAGAKYHKAGLLLLERLIGKDQVLSSSSF